MTPKIYVKSMKNQGYVADAFLERFGAALGCQMLDFGIQNLQNITKIAIKIYPKSMENRGCVADVFFKRFGMPKCLRIGCFWDPFGDHFPPKIKKWHPKKHAKIDAEKVSKNDAKMMPK